MTEVAVPEQVPTAVAVNGSEQPISNGNGEQPAATTEANGNAEVNGTPNGHSAKKEKKKPINPTEDPEGFLQQVLKSSGALNKMNYHILKWLVETAEPDESKRKALPGKAGSNSVEPKQFVQYLADGVVLAQLANKLVPGSIETIHEGEAAADKANQTANLQGFVDMKNKSGIAPEQTITVEELQAPKWKTTYQALFKTLYHMSTQAPQTFNTATGLDAQQIADEISNIIKAPIFQRIRHSASTIISTIINGVHAQSPAKSATQPAAAAENGNGHAEASNGNGTTEAAATEGEPKASESVPEPAPATVTNGST